jgi:hypothetical protein
MARSTIASVLSILMLGVAVPVGAEDKSAEASVVRPPDVAPAWATDTPSRPSSASVNVLYVSYGALQGLDMYSTVVARQRGAVEGNAMMNTGFTRAAAFKAAMSVSTILAARAMAKKNRKAAIITMMALNSVAAVVVANNLRNARRLQ